MELASLVRKHSSVVPEIMQSRRKKSKEIAPPQTFTSLSTYGYDVSAELTSGFSSNIKSSCAVAQL